MTTSVVLQHFRTYGNVLFSPNSIISRIYKMMAVLDRNVLN